MTTPTTEAATHSVLKGKRCKCPCCGEVFSSSSGFDKHRKGDHNVNRHCVSPESVGMVIRKRGENTYWTTPITTGFRQGAAL